MIFFFYVGGVKDLVCLVVGDQILFICVGWCGKCGLSFGLISFKYFMEFSKLRIGNWYRFL